jgi:type I restriction enzyme, S subunit
MGTTAYPAYPFYSPMLTCLQINHTPWVLQYFAKDQQGGVMASVKSDTLRRVLLPVPPPPEMAPIEKRMNAISKENYNILKM